MRCFVTSPIPLRNCEADLRSMLVWKQASTRCRVACEGRTPYPISSHAVARDDPAFLKSSPCSLHNAAMLSARPWLLVTQAHNALAVAVAVAVMVLVLCCVDIALLCCVVVLLSPPLWLHFTCHVGGLFPSTHYAQSHCKRSRRWVKMVLTSILYPDSGILFRMQCASLGVSHCETMTCAHVHVPHYVCCNKLQPTLCLHNGCMMHAWRARYGWVVSFFTLSMICIYGKRKK